MASARARTGCAWFTRWRAWLCLLATAGAAVLALRSSAAALDRAAHADAPADAEQRPGAERRDGRRRSPPSGGARGGSSSRPTESARPAGTSSTSRPGPKCPGPQRAPELPSNEREALRRSIVRTAEAWDYATSKVFYAPLKGMRVLDIGMGQGPMGVMALESGVKTYTGLDPALCINQRAMTRNKKIKRTPQQAECEVIRRSHCASAADEASCSAYQNCIHILNNKYKLFPFTGLDMMSAFPGKLQLLPGTFESLEHSGFLQRGMFDVATLWMVTEHLPNNRLVIEGVFKWLEPKQFLVLMHHNYYCYDGHHGRPQNPKDFDKTNAFQRERANWGHLDPTSSPYNDRNLNRIRLGDLLALVEVYFECAWRVHVPPGPRGLLQPNSELLRKLTARGFNLTELLVNKLEVACVRRERPAEAPWLDKILVHHPPADGSYVPQPLPAEMERSVVIRKEAAPMKAVARLPRLTKLLGQRGV